ncbi:MAG: sigma-70 family RNA polymerase sigma factor [Planctomycetota bacterium]
MIDQLIQSHGDRVLALLSRLLGNAEDVKDVYQETWCAVWRALPRLRPETDAWPYIRKAAVRKALDWIRSQGSRPVTTGLPAGAVAAPAENRQEQRVDLSTLKNEQRVCLTLFFWEGCSVAEIAGELGVPQGTVKTWMHRARKELRSQLGEEEASA